MLLRLIHLFQQPEQVLTLLLIQRGGGIEVTVHGDLFQFAQQCFAAFAEKDAIRALVRLATHADRQRALFELVQ